MTSPVDVTIRPARDDDLAAILAVLASNRADPSLFQQPEHQVRRTLGDFVVAIDDEGRVLACAAVRFHRPDNAEILAVSVAPAAQSRGVGRALMQVCLDRALAAPRVLVWLATAKPEYFARYGFVPMTKWALPISVLLTKLRLVFQQPAARWGPTLAGRHTFMRRRG